MDAHDRDPGSASHVVVAANHLCKVYRKLVIRSCRELASAFSPLGLRA